MRFALFASIAMLAFSPAAHAAYEPPTGSDVSGQTVMGRTLSARAADVSNIMDQTGVDPTGSTSVDNSIPLNAAAVATRNGHVADVYVPGGSFYIKNPITLASGQCLIGDGVGTSTIFWGSDFNTSAAAVVTLTGTEQNAPCVKNISLTGLQPGDFATTTTASTAATGTTITLANVSGLQNGYYIGDTQTGATAAIPRHATVTNIAGNVVTLSTPVVAPGVGNGDSIHWAQPRANYQTLAAGCTTTAGGTGCKYPPVIYSQNSNRLRIENVRIGGAWDGINLTNTGAGGASLTNLQIGALNIGLNVAGMRDYLHLTSIHSWQFGFSGLALLSTYADGATTAGQFADVDGIDLKGFTVEAGNVSVLSSASTSQDPWNWTNFQLDGGSLTVANVLQINISGWSIVNGGSVPFSGSPFSVSGGKVVAVAGYLATNSASQPAVSVTGGNVSITRAYLDNENGGGNVATVSSGTLSISQSQVLTHSASQSVPLLAQSSTGVLQANAVAFSSGTAGQVGIQIGAYNILNQIIAPIWNGLSLQEPGGNTGALNGSILYSTPGTYTYYPTPGAKTVTVTMCGGGGGGGGGGLVASGTAISGGGGGGGGDCPPPVTYRVSDLSTSGITVIVGAGGPGGLGATTNSTSGGVGAAGTLSSFASFSAYAGGFGSAGTASTASAGGGGGGLAGNGGNASGSTAGAGGFGGGSGGSGAQASTLSTSYVGGGGSGSSAAGAAFVGGKNLNGGPGGATGGGVTSAPASTNGGAGTCPFLWSSTPAGGTSGTPTGTAGTGIANTPYQPGCSGGGGYGNSAGNGGNAGASGLAAGGSGGGSALNGSTAGNGVKGGDGVVYIVEN